jgi:hypothetical protein
LALGLHDADPWIWAEAPAWNYLTAAERFFNRTEDGPPIPWRCGRPTEGYDDYRYVHTLQQMIATAKKQGGKAGRVAEQAQQDLDTVWDDIRVQSKYKWDDLWEPREADVYRWISRAILKLQEAG